MANGRDARRNTHLASAASEKIDEAIKRVAGGVVNSPNPNVGAVQTGVLGGSAGVTAPSPHLGQTGVLGGSAGVTAPTDYAPAPLNSADLTALQNVDWGFLGPLPKGSQPPGPQGPAATGPERTGQAGVGFNFDNLMAHQTPQAQTAYTPPEIRDAFNTVADLENTDWSFLDKNKTVTPPPAAPPAAPPPGPAADNPLVNQFTGPGATTADELDAWYASQGIYPDTGGGGGAPAPASAPAPAGPAPANFYRPADLASQIRSLMGELSTTDYSQDIRDMIAGRRTGVTEAETRRRGQIDEIARQLGLNIDDLETGRAAQQKALVDAVAGRASGLTTGIDDRLAAARQDLGPQVSDEFERTAQLVSGLGASQAGSSQDAMARLAQVADMVAAERGAAPAQLGAEAKLALGDEAFRMLQGLDQEQTQRLLAESMRQEEFNTRRDEAMVQALLGDVGRREDFLTREAERLQGQAFQSDEAAAQRLWQSGEAGAQREWQGQQAIDQREWQGQQAVDERDWREGESALDRAMRVSESQLGRDLQRDQMAESARQRGLDRKFQSDEARKAGVRSTQAATTAFNRQQQQIFEAQTYEESVRVKEELAESAAAQAITQGSASAAAHFMGIVDDEGNPTAEGAAMWDAMPEAAKTQMYKDMVAAEDMEGARWQPGTYANMVGKYGEANSDHILHAEHMFGMTEEQQKEYLNSLMTTDDPLRTPAMDANDAQKINMFLAEIQAANAARQAANLAQAQLAAAGYADESGWSDEFRARQAGAAGAYGHDAFSPVDPSVGAPPGTVAAPGWRPGDSIRIGPGGY